MEYFADRLERIMKENYSEKELANRLKQILKEDFQEDERHYNPDPSKGEFRASSLPYCSRKQVFQYYLDWEYPEDSPIVKAANTGTAIHKFLQSLLESDDILCEEKVQINIDDITIYGHVDMLIQEEDMHLLIDIKTTSSLSSIEEYGAKNHHIAQLNIYLSAIQERLQNQNIDVPLWGELMYISRRLSISNLVNSEKWLIYEYGHDEELLQSLIDKAKRIKTTLEEGNLPAIDAEQWECHNRAATCPYFDYCHVTRLNRIEELEQLGLF